MSDRLYVMNEGSFIGELTAAEASQEAVMRSIVSSYAPGRNLGEHVEVPRVGAPRPTAHFLKSNLREYGMVVALVAIMVFFQRMTDGTLLQPLNLTNLVLQNSYIVVMALGMLLVIVAGHIDLSVGSTSRVRRGGRRQPDREGELELAPGDRGLSRDRRRRRGLARLSGGLPEDPGVHRDARQHVDLPWSHARRDR